MIGRLRMLPRPVVIGVVVVVTLGWAVNLIIGFTSPARHDPTLNALLGVVVGAALALRPQHHDDDRDHRP